MNDVNLFYKDLKGYPRGDLLILARKYNISDKLNNKSLAREIAKVHSEGIMQVGRMLFKTDCVDDVKTELDIIQNLIKATDDKTASDPLKSVLLIQQGVFKKGCEELLKTAKNVRKEIEKAIGIDNAARKHIPGIPVLETPPPKVIETPPYYPAEIYAALKKPSPKVETTTPKAPSPKFGPVPKRTPPKFPPSPEAKFPPVPKRTPPKFQPEELECSNDVECQDFIAKGKLSTKCKQQPVVCVELKDGEKHCYHKISKGSN